jgi:hypothetical protein
LVAFAPAEVSDLLPGDPFDPVEEPEPEVGVDSAEAVLDLPSEAVEDLSLDSLLRAFFLASEG